MMKRYYIYTFLFALPFLACQNNNSSPNLKKGKYLINKLYNQQQTISFDSVQPYHLIIDTINVSVSAEDNILTAQYLITKDSIKISNMRLTDVCCNTHKANAVFSFFQPALQWKVKADTLTLSTSSARLQLVFLEK